MVDPDGDTLKCRWAVGRECDSICYGVPVATLDEVNKTMPIMHLCAKGVDFSIECFNSEAFCADQFHEAKV